MGRDAIFNIIKENILELFPELVSKEITENDSLKNLGANSIDRTEIIMLTLSRLKINIPLVTFATAKNIGGLIDIFAHESQPTD